MSSVDPSSASGSVASSPEPESLPPAFTKKHKKQPKNAGKDSNEQNNESDANWAYVPPTSFKPAPTISVNPDFDWDTINEDKDNELWVIRVPDGIKPKYLEGLRIEVPPNTSVTTKVGTLPRKHATFDLWAVGADTDSALPNDSGSAYLCAEEMKALSCLLPRGKKKGKLLLAPRGIQRHLVLSAQAVKPAPPEPTSTSPVGTTPKKNPPRFRYPPEVLKHRFAPYGSQCPAPTSHKPTDAMDVDHSLDASVVPSSPKKHKHRKSQAAPPAEAEEEDIVAASLSLDPDEPPADSDALPTSPSQKKTKSTPRRRGKEKEVQMDIDAPEGSGPNTREVDSSPSTKKSKSNKRKVVEGATEDGETKSRSKRQKADPTESATSWKSAEREGKGKSKVKSKKTR